MNDVIDPDGVTDRQEEGGAELGGEDNLIDAIPSANPHKSTITLRM